MERYARGMPLTQKIKEPLYHNGEFPDVAGLDLTEIAALKRKAEENVREIQRRLKKQEADQIKSEQEKLQKTIKELTEKLNNQSNKDTVNKTTNS